MHFVKRRASQRNPPGSRSSSRRRTLKGENNAAACHTERELAAALNDRRPLSSSARRSLVRLHAAFSRVRVGSGGALDGLAQPSRPLFHQPLRQCRHHQRHHQQRTTIHQTVVGRGDDC